MNSPAWRAFPLVVLVGCATAKPVPQSAETTVPAPAKPMDVRAAMARELAPMAKVPLTSPTGEFSGEVEAAGPMQIQPGEEVTSINIPFGASQPLHCLVYKNVLDTGGQLLSVLKGAKEKVSVEAVWPTDVLVIGEHPVTSLEIQYLAKTEQGMAGGQLKAVVYPHPKAPVMCLHDELGYRETFKRITQGLLTSLKPQNEVDATVKQTEVQIVRIDGKPVGFERRSTFDTKDGMSLTEVISALLLPRSKNDLVAMDTVTRSLSDKKGELVNLDYVRAVNGELEVQVSAKRGTGREYAYEGKHSGKDIAGKFKAKDKQGVAGDPLINKAMKEKLLAGKTQELKFELYQPSINPAGTVEMVCRKEGKEGRNVTVALGQLTIAAVADADGQLEKIEMPMGSAKLVQERAFIRGQP